MKMTNVAGSITAKGDFSRFLTLGVVLPAQPLHPKEEGFPLMICYPEKLVKEAVSLFQARFQMHQRVYTHKVVKQIEFMITDALILADPFITIPGTKTVAHPTGEYRMSQCIEDMAAFSRLNDSILDVIALARNPISRPSENLDKAKALIERIRNRDLYTCVGSTSFSSDGKIAEMSESEIADEILDYASGGSSSLVGNIFEAEIKDEEPARKMPRTTAESPNGLCRDDIIVEKMHIHHGMKSKNPVDRLRFFTKGASNGSNTGRKVEEKKYESILPRSFEDRSVRVFCRSTEKTESIRHAFDAWCTRMNAHSPFPSANFLRDDDEEDEYEIYASQA